LSTEDAHAAAGVAIPRPATRPAREEGSAPTHVQRSQALRRARHAATSRVPSSPVETRLVAACLSHAAFSSRRFTTRSFNGEYRPYATHSAIKTAAPSAASHGHQSRLRRSESFQAGMPLRTPAGGVHFTSHISGSVSE